jgi:hypothetical protein
LAKLTKQTSPPYFTRSLFRYGSKKVSRSIDYSTASDWTSAPTQAIEDHARAIQREGDRRAREEHVENSVPGVDVGHSPDQQPDAKRAENCAHDDDPMDYAHRMLTHEPPAFRSPQKIWGSVNTGRA